VVTPATNDAASHSGRSHHHATKALKEIVMGTKHGWGALVAAGAVMGWALQAPQAGTLAVARPAVPQATTPVDAPAPSLSVLTWPQPDMDTDGDTSVRAQASTNMEIEISGLEEMSATGAAVPALPMR
jgi:hypothetical protein